MRVYDVRVRTCQENIIEGAKVLESFGLSVIGIKEVEE